MTLLPGTLYLIDTSAFTRIYVKQVQDILGGVIDAGVAATCITVDLEAGYSARNAEGTTKAFAAREMYFQQLTVTVAIEERARNILVRMAARGLHRAAGAIDILTAAIAEHYRATVLHYDADFEHIASVTGQQHQWIVPRGTID